MLEKIVSQKIENKILKNVFLSIEKFIKDKIINFFKSKNLSLYFKDNFENFPDIYLDFTFLSKNSFLHERMYLAVKTIKIFFATKKAYEILGSIFKFYSRISYSIRMDATPISTFLRIIDGFLPNSVQVFQYLLSKIDTEEEFLNFLVNQNNIFDVDVKEGTGDPDPEAPEVAFDDDILSKLFMFDADTLFTATTVRNLFSLVITPLCTESRRNFDKEDFILSKESSKLFFELADRIKPFSSIYISTIEYPLELNEGRAGLKVLYSFDENPVVYNNIVAYLFDKDSLLNPAIEKYVEIGRQSFYDLEFLDFCYNNGYTNFNSFSENPETFFYDILFRAQMADSALHLVQNIYNILYFTKYINDFSILSFSDLKKLDIMDVFISSGISEIIIRNRSNDTVLLYIGIPKFFPYLYEHKIAYSFSFKENSIPVSSLLNPNIQISTMNISVLQSYNNIKLTYDYDNDFIYFLVFDSSNIPIILDSNFNSIYTFSNSLDPNSTFIEYYSGKLYVFSDQLYIYDLLNNNISSILFPSYCPDSNYSLCRVDEDSIYLFGGLRGSNNLFNLVQFDFTSNFFSLRVSYFPTEITSILGGSLVYDKENNYFELFNFNYTLKNLSSIFYSEKKYLRLTEKGMSDFLYLEKEYEYILQNSNKGIFYIEDTKYLLNKNEIIYRLSRIPNSSLKFYSTIVKNKLILLYENLLYKISLL